MKRLLVAGAGPIFQFARVWRNAEGSDLHAPEFTMLEWHRPPADMDLLMDETEVFLRSVLPPTVACRGITTSLELFERLTVADAFTRYAGADYLGTANNAPALASSARVTLRPNETWEDLFFRLLLERIEPHIGRAHPTFLTHWPAAQAALARRDPRDPRVAERFELPLRHGTGQRLRRTDRRDRTTCHGSRKIARAAMRRTALIGRWTRTSSPHSPSACRPAPASHLGFDRLAMIAV